MNTHDFIRELQDEFARYARNHRAKVQKQAEEIKQHEIGSTEYCRIQGLIDDTVQKAEVNEANAREIEQHIQTIPLLEITDNTVIFHEGSETYFLAKDRVFVGEVEDTDLDEPDIGVLVKFQGFQLKVS